MIDYESLAKSNSAFLGELEAAAARVIRGGWYVLGEEVSAFELEFAQYLGAKHCIGVANGLDALILSIEALNLPKGSDILVASNTYIATILAIVRAGHCPVLVEPKLATFNMDAALLPAVMTAKTRAICVTHLFGKTCRMDAIGAFAHEHGLRVVEDCAQSHGAKLGKQMTGTFGDAGCFSFYPTKNLGAYGDGGAVITDDPQLATRLKRLRFYGQAERYQAVERGINSRLDEIQAAILSVKLKYLDAHNQARRVIADFYEASLSGVERPRLRQCGDGSANAQAVSIHHVYHQYVIRHAQRNELSTALRNAGVETQIHYPIPVHRQPAYADLGYSKGSLPVTERIADQILSLPIGVGLTTTDLALVANAIAAFTEKEGCHNAA